MTEEIKMKVNLKLKENKISHLTISNINLQRLHTFGDIFNKFNFIYLFKLKKYFKT